MSHHTTSPNAPLGQRVMDAADALFPEVDGFETVEERLFALVVEAAATLHHMQGEPSSSTTVVALLENLEERFAGDDFR